MKQSHKARIFAISLLAVAVAAVGVALLVSSDDPRHPGGLLRTPATVTAGGPSAAGPANVYVSDELYPATLELVAKFRADNPRARFNLHHAPSLEALTDVQKDREATLYIDEDKAIAAMSEKPKQLNPFGNDVLLITVARGNPKGVSSLAVFGDGTTATGLCAPEVRCGAAANAALASAGVTPTPSLVSPDPDALVSDVQAGRLDAALVFRTHARKRFLRVGAVAAEPNAKIDYQMATLSANSTTAQFVQFVRNSPDAARILQRTGLRGFDRPKAKEAP